MEISKLTKLANRLDSIGLTKEADILDSIILKIANNKPLIISDPRDPTKKIEVDTQIFSAMQAARGMVPPEFVSWVTDGAGNKRADAFFATSLWDNAGLDYIEKLQVAGPALRFYLNLLTGLPAFPLNDTKSWGGKIRYNLDKRYAGARSRASTTPTLDEKMDKGYTDFVANTLPAISEPVVMKIVTALSFVPVIGVAGSSYLLATHIYEREWALAAMDLAGLILSFLLVGKIGLYMARGAASLGTLGVRSTSALRHPQFYASVFDVAWSAFTVKVDEIAKEAETKLANVEWKNDFLATLNGLKTNKKLVEEKARPMIEAEMAKQPKA